jgi:HAMP domain-containing protein
MFRLADNPLVRAVARVPATVQRKLLVAFAGIVCLLVILGVLGLRELSASNDRVVSLGELPQRIETYRELQLDTDQLGELFATRNRLIDFAGGAYPNKQPPDRAAVAVTDGTIQSILSRLGPFTGVTSLGYVPPLAERGLLTEIHSEFGQLRLAVSSVVAKDQAGDYSAYDGQLRPDQDLVTNLESNADQLVSMTQADTANLIASNQASYVDSQHVVIGVAAGSILLVLLLGVGLSGSLIVPIQRVRARLEAITSGDFSDHVSVPNRDELGALAKDLNRMNDELRRLYGELQTANRHKSEFLANISHELRAYASVTHQVDVEDVGSLQLEGFQDPVQASNVTGLKDSRPSREEPATSDERPAPNAFIREGDFWSLTYEGVVVRLKDSKGLRDIARLLATPGREVAAVDLASEGHRDVGRSLPAIADLGLRVERDAGNALDAEARTQYRSRLADLEEEISEDDANNNAERASRAREEREFLLAELGAAVGLGGRSRRLLDPAERARKAVRERVDDAITHIEKAHYGLGKHLRRSVRTGIFCIYDPTDATAWRLFVENPRQPPGQP